MYKQEQRLFRIFPGAEHALDMQEWRAHF